MPRLLLLTATLLLASGCVSFSETQRAQVEDAQTLAARAVDDPRFGEVLLDMSDALDWEGKLSEYVSPPPAGPTSWLVQSYADRGTPEVGDVRPYVPYLGFGVFSATSASAGYGSDRVRLNVLHLERPLSRTRRDAISIANTLVHERAHTFGQVHGDSQTAVDNVCDAAYVAGDLAEALLRHERAGAPIDADEISQPVCDALLTRLRSRGIVR